MKSIGIVRKLDPVGRLVLPKELRDTLDIKEGEPVEFFVDGKMVVIRKYVPKCMFCGSSNAVADIMGKNVCDRCKYELINL